MKKLIVLCVVLICSSFINFPTVAMHVNQNGRVHKPIVNECGKKLKTPSSKKSHPYDSNYQVNSMSNGALNSRKIASENICYQCPEPKKLTRCEYYRNHMIRQHGICPWCFIQLSNEVKHLKMFSVENRKKGVAHLEICSQENNTSLFVCDICFGVVMVTKKIVHIKSSCTGNVFRISNKTYTARETELSTLSDESLLLSEFIHQLDQPVLIRLQDEDDNPSESTQKNDNVQEECNALGRIDFTYKTILNDSVCPSLTSQNSLIRSQSCDVSGN